MKDRLPFHKGTSHCIVGGSLNGFRMMKSRIVLAELMLCPFKRTMRSLFPASQRGQAPIKRLWLSREKEIVRRDLTDDIPLVFSVLYAV